MTQRLSMILAGALALSLTGYSPAAQAQHRGHQPAPSAVAPDLSAPLIQIDGVPVGALLAPPDSVAVSLPPTDSLQVLPVGATLIGPALPPGFQLSNLVAAPTPALPGTSADSLALVRNQRIGGRLRELQKTIPLVYNPYVRGFIDYFTIRNPKYTRRMLEKQNLYFPIYERKLAQYGLPPELKYLSVVESALNTKAASKALAVGLWQFIPEAAKDYHLVINSWKDERMDPEKATDAACRYLKNLNRAFGGDWELALAAYNCGPGNVRRAIAKAGGRANFWAIFPFLPQETRGYVPSFTAVVYAMTYAGEYGIVPETIHQPVATDTVMVTGALDLQKLATALGLGEKAIYDLNYELRRPLLPALPNGYALKIPADSRLAFAALNRAEVLASCRPASAATVALALDSARSARQKRFAAGRYVVQRGENVQRVALKNGCTVAQLRAWNRLRPSSKLRAGQAVVVWHAVKPRKVVVDDASTLAANKLTADSARNAAAGAAVVSNKPVRSTDAPLTGSPATASALVAPEPVPAAALAAAPAAGVAGLSADQQADARQNGYTVRSGDNLFQIARTFSLSVSKLAEWNGLKNHKVIIGQTLALRGPAAENADVATTTAATPAATSAPETTEVASAEPLPGGELAGDSFTKPPVKLTASQLAARRAYATRLTWLARARQQARHVHLVQPGDTLWNIANKRGVSVEQLRRLNKLKSDALKPGQKIVVS